MKILIAGAGVGGLYAAYLFGKRGHSVTVYERAESLEKMRYDWHDDVNPSVFKRLGLTVPKESFPKGDWTFVSPCGNKKSVIQKEENIDLSIERRPLNAYLYGLASEVADIVFGVEVISAITENDNVIGLKIDDGEVKDELCDLVIDSGGALSSVRSSLPARLGVETEVKPEETFVAYRAFYNAVPDAKVEFPNKVYMKHLGQQGISWCIFDNDVTSVNVLIGRVGEMTSDVLDEAFDDLRKDNPILGTEVKRGGIVATIPVRRPLSVFIANGYAAIGDAACMTVPLIGSGIATSLLAAKFLFDAVGESNTPDKITLWQYQLSCYREFGAQHWGVESLKNWLLDCTPADIDWIFGSGIISNEDLQTASVGGMIKLTPKQIIEKLKIGIKNLPLLLKLASAIFKSDSITKKAAKIPTEYDENKINRWAESLNRKFTGEMY